MFSRLRLGTQLWLFVSIVLAAASVGLALYLTRVETRALALATKQRLDIKEDNLTAKAALLARNAALASAAAAVSLDFDFLQGVVVKTVTGDSSILYGYIVDGSGKAVVHSDPARVGTTIPATTKPTASANDVSVQLIGNTTLEANAPIMLGDEVWGCVRYGVSYEPMLREAASAAQTLAEARRKNFAFSALLAAVLVVVCVCVSIVAATRLVRPLRALEATIQRVLARGAGVRVEVPRIRELARVAQGFNVLLARLDEWESRLRGERLKADLAAFASDRKLTDEARQELYADWQGQVSQKQASIPTSAPASGGSLKVRLIGLMLGLTTASVLTIGAALYERMRADLTSSLDAMSGQVQLDLADKGFSITHNAALAVSQAASVREYLFLMQIVRSTLTADTDIVTGFIKDPKGRVLVHSDPKKTGSIVQSTEHTDAMRLGRTESHFVEEGGARILEITSPIEVGGAAWGTLSFGLSDEHQRAVFADLKRVQDQRMRDARVATAVGVGVLLVIAAIVAWLASRRIVGPLDRLTRDLEKICSGARSLRVEVYSCRELTTFSMSINELTAMTLERERELERAVQQSASA